MKCPICQTENPASAKTCSACGSSLATRGGADIIMRHDGSVDHAGESRWKMGAGAAGGGTLLALGKFGLISSIFKVYWIVSLVHLASLGGWGIVIAVAGIAAIVGGSLFHFRRRLQI